MVRGVYGMVGDVGGTNARFALAEVSGGKIRLEEPVTLKAADYKTGEDAVCAFLEKLGGQRPKGLGCSGAKAYCIVVTEG